MSSKINLVTGATGQLGSHIVEQLRASGESVRALVRPGRDLAFLQQQGARSSKATCAIPSRLGVL